MKLFTALVIGLLLAAGPAVFSLKAQTAGQTPTESTGKPAKHSKNKAKHKTKKPPKSKQKTAS
jgi:hypothetical protein